MTPDRTRRELLADAGRVSLAAGVLLGGPVSIAAAQGSTAPAPVLPTDGTWTNQDYWAFADWR